MAARLPIHERPAAAGGSRRLPQGGHIDRQRLIPFHWNGRELDGCAGDTLASALLAHDIRVVGRSFKFHRPRGILSAGAEEPNALVTLGRGARLDATVRATLVRLEQGLEARAQNCWPSVDFDVGRVLDFAAPLWPAGFYNKTFLWPSWHTYEPFIRAAAGLGDALTEPDPDRYDAVNASTDLLVVGGGPAGLQVACRAVRAGWRVILVEQGTDWGGSLLAESAEIDGRPGADWVRDRIEELSASPHSTLLTMTTAFGLYDHGTAGLIERVADRSPDAGVRQRYWRVRTASIVLATGAIEQPALFEGNDLPGIMLAGAARDYATRFGVAVGRRVVFATNNDSAYRAALELSDAGVTVPVLLDSREVPPPALARALSAAGIEVRGGTLISAARGTPSLTRVRTVDCAGRTQDEIDCDALGMSGGFAPTVHLYSQARGQLRFDVERRCFLPVPGTAPVGVAGAVAGAHTLADTLASADAAVEAQAQRLGRNIPPPAPVRVGVRLVTDPAVAPLPRAARGRAHRQWVDFQHDVTVSDVALAIREGYDAIEHLKRYTTAGMSVDQGKTSNLNALLLAAELTGRDPGEVGTTTYRPPYMPVTLGAIAGRAVGAHYAPRRLLPAHAEHARLNAHWQEAGGWMRPDAYPRAGESIQQAIRREAVAVRESVGLFDASPLGKIEVSGPDAAIFLDRFYVNNVLSLEVGRSRYGLMLNENGVIIDDGTVARLAADHFVITTTSGGAGRIGQWLEEWLQCEWPTLDVLVTPVTTQWATMALSGPRAREVLGALQTDIDLAPAAFPHLHVRTGMLAGVPARLYRMSFSGELGFEINVPARYGAALWRELLDAGQRFGITPYGLEALLLLRLEKGFLHVGVDTDGTTSPADVGWGEIASRKSRDFIGKRSLSRPDNLRADRLHLVGLHGDDAAVLVPGAHVRLAATTEGSDGWVTSAVLSPALGRPIALALVRGGRARLGEHLSVHDLDRTTSATIVSAAFYDPSGDRLHG